MNKVSRYVFAFCAVVLLLTSLGFKKGDWVLAPWGSSVWQAKIAEVKGAKATIVWYDGSKGTAEVSQLIPLVKLDNAKVGSLCYAQWGDHSYYKSKVIKVDGKKVTIEYLSDKSKHVVEIHKLFKP